MFPTHEALKYADYDAALGEALADREPGRRIMVARMVHAESLW